MNRLCTICARGGSKGVKNKNVLALLGKPLLAHSIIQARESHLFTSIAISSDCSEILKIAKDFGADYLIKRPASLACDHSPKVPVMRHCLQEVERQANTTFETIVDLDATSPLRSLADIKGAVELLEDRKVKNVITGTPSRRSPYFNLCELDQHGYAVLSKQIHSAVTCRQEAPRCFDLNASIYVWKRTTLLEANGVFNGETLLYVMLPERSIDIDSELDFEFVEYLAKKRGELL